MKYALRTPKGPDVMGILKFTEIRDEIGEDRAIEMIEFYNKAKVDVIKVYALYADLAAYYAHMKYVEAETLEEELRYAVEEQELFLYLIAVTSEEELKRNLHAAVVFHSDKYTSDKH